MKTIQGLIWLRFISLKKNKNILFIALLPYLFAFLYTKFLVGDNFSEKVFIISTCLTMGFSTSSLNIITSTIAEEKEKYNLKTLLLSGVSSLEYIFSTLVIPIILGLMTILILPHLVQVDFGANYTQYLFINSLTLIVHIFLGLVIAMLSETQAKAQMNSMPVLLLSSFLPMLSPVNEQIKKLCDFSYVGAHTKFFNNFASGQNILFIWTDMIILCVWIVLLFVLTIVFYNKAKKGNFTINLKMHLPSTKKGGEAACKL